MNPPDPVQCCANLYPGAVPQLAVTDRTLEVAAEEVKQLEAQLHRERQERSKREAALASSLQALQAQEKRNQELERCVASSACLYASCPVSCVSASRMLNSPQPLGIPGVAESPMACRIWSWHEGWGRVTGE